jgi:hypothetical protein
MSWIGAYLGLKSKVNTFRSSEYKRRSREIIFSKVSDNRSNIALILMNSINLQLLLLWYLVSIFIVSFIHYWFGESISSFCNSFHRISSCLLNLENTRLEIVRIISPSGCIMWREHDWTNDRYCQRYTCILLKPLRWVNEYEILLTLWVTICG